MKTWVEAKNAYVKDPLSKPLKAPNIRLDALKNIEAALKAKDKALLEGSLIFQKHNKSSLLDFYLRLKGKPLNSAEKSVIHGLFKFAL
jgi:hypothetical protein